jgi:hypothetical protein
MTPTIPYVLSVSVAAAAIHAVCMWDAALQYREFQTSDVRNRDHLRILAIAGMRSAFFRLIQQLVIVRLGWVFLHANTEASVHDVLRTLASTFTGLDAHDVTELRVGLVSISLISIIKELWAMYDRYRSIRAYHRDLVARTRFTDRA